MIDIDTLFLQWIARRLFARSGLKGGPGESEYDPSSLSGR
jgi:hypothetical protein